jgi:hypothetical protein
MITMSFPVAVQTGWGNGPFRVRFTDSAGNIYTTTSNNPQQLFKPADHGEGGDDDDDDDHDHDDDDDTGNSGSRHGRGRTSVVRLP